MAKVATQAGEKKFKAPVGTAIGVDGGEFKLPETITAVRLMSLNSQLQAARATSNTALLNILQPIFTEALRKFSDGKSPDQVMDAIKAATAPKEE